MWASQQAGFDDWATTLFADLKIWAFQRGSFREHRPWTMAVG
jgi:hypothetical protein